MRIKEPTSDWYEYINFTDIVLNNNSSNKYTLSNPFLSPTVPSSERLKLLSKLRDLSFPKKLSLRLKFYFNFFKSIINLLDQFILSHPNINTYKESLKEKRYDIIIVSHLNNKIQLKSDIDDYYDDLMSQLSKKGKSILLLFIPHTNCSRLDIKKYLSKDRNYDSHILMSRLVDFKSKFYCLSKLLNERNKFLRLSAQNNGYIKNLYLFAAEVFISPVNYIFSIYSIQIAQIVKETRAKNIITTYEGHAWERLFYCSCREYVEDIKCFGFQHSLIFKYNHSLLRALRNEWNPNCILTTGELTTELLTEKLSNRTIITTLGNPKYKLNSKDCIDVNNSNTILVIPCGTYEESEYLTEFSYKYAKSNPNINLIIRYHPIIRDKFISYKLPYLNNLKISSSDIINDSSKSRWAIYSSSTAIFEAIKYGCIPIHLNCGLITDLSDPLWQVNSDLIQYIIKPNELDKILIDYNYSYKNSIMISKQYKDLLIQLNKLKTIIDIEKLSKQLH
tara:strand:+ start:327 stop:1841 length:1515 start_codon:yes stop_codon:yes gene_type:complete